MRVIELALEITCQNLLPHLVSVFSERCSPNSLGLLLKCSDARFDEINRQRQRQQIKFKKNNCMIALN